MSSPRTPASVSVGLQDRVRPLPEYSDTGGVTDSHAKWAAIAQILGAPLESSREQTGIATRGQRGFSGTGVRVRRHTPPLWVDPEWPAAPLRLARDSAVPLAESRGSDNVFSDDQPDSPQDRAEVLAILERNGPGLEFSGAVAVALAGPLVYVWLREEIALYVGHSQSGIGRPFSPQHHRVRPEPTDRVLVYFVATAAEARRLETLLIHRLQPRDNQQQTASVLADRLGITTGHATTLARQLDREASGPRGARRERAQRQLMTAQARVARLEAQLALNPERS